MQHTLETVETVAVECGDRGPIVEVDRDVHGPGAGFYEIVSVQRTTDLADYRIVSLRVLGLPVRKDGERRANAVYPTAVYGTEPDAVAALWLDGVVLDPDRYADVE